eukprot:9215455-Alexandrium_andersonii.AAC.1
MLQAKTAVGGGRLAPIWTASTGHACALSSGTARHDYPKREDRTAGRCLQVAAQRNIAKRPRHPQRAQVGLALQGVPGGAAGLIWGVRA